jgi:uncharacterized protein (DUF2132 family)
MEEKKSGLNQEKQPNNPLYGKTLEMVINHLVGFYGWEQLGYHINIKCFTDNPSVKSSLTFLRKTPWARKKVENLYLEIQE